MDEKKAVEPEAPTIGIDLSGDHQTAVSNFVEGMHIGIRSTGRGNVVVGSVITGCGTGLKSGE